MAMLERMPQPEPAMPESAFPQPEPSDLSAGGETNRENLHETLLPRLRDFIVEGRLKPGERIPERELCAMFEVSRTPLREALKVLAAEDLIELLPNRGARVRVFTQKDIMDIFEILAALESVAGRFACERITEEEIAEIEKLHYDMYSFYMSGNLPEYFKANQLIHEKIVAAARNEALQATYSKITGRVRQLRYRANTEGRERWSNAVREHEAMIHALRQRAGDDLSAVLFNHMISKAKSICAKFEA